MKHNLKVTIAIPAYNEENNIKNLLYSISSQVEKGFSIHEIMIISDGSTDQTIKKVKEVKDKRIKIIDNKNRIGKPKRLNQLFKIFSYDILIILDADVILRDKWVIRELVSKFQENLNTALVLGRQLALKPTTFIERLAYFGFEFWEDAKNNLGEKAILYHCTGQIRAFSKNFISHFILPNVIKSGEDAYSFYFAKKNNFRVVYAENAIVYFRLAANFKDYIKQMTRFILIPSDMKKYFGKEIVKQYSTITRSVKYKALFAKMIVTPPHISFSYLVVQIVTKINSKIYSNKSIWDIASSSKILNIHN